MAIQSHQRTYDLVLLGATGYTGTFTARHIATYFPASLKWAVAGRSQPKLQALVDDLSKIVTDRPLPAIEVCALDLADLTPLAQKTRLLISTIGPFSLLGEPAFRACAENGTHYVDVTGETPWIASMIHKYGAIARETGAIMVPQASLDSTPSDLCTWAMAKTLRTELGAKTADVTMTIVVNGAPSGGTLASVLAIYDTFHLKDIINVFITPYSLSPIPNPHRRRRPRPSFWTRLTGLRTHPVLGLTTTSITNISDRPIVERSWGLMQIIPSRTDEFYGPNFTWAQHLHAQSRLTGIAAHYSTYALGFLISTIPPVRSLIRRFVIKPGGPTAEQAKDDIVIYRGLAEPDSDDPEVRRKRVYCEAKHRGPVYYFSGLLIAEAARTILEEDLQLGSGGVFTPACLGQGYMDRLSKVGFSIETRVVDV